MALARLGRATIVFFLAGGAWLLNLCGLSVWRGSAVLAARGRHRSFCAVYHATGREGLARSAMALVSGLGARLECFLSWRHRELLELLFTSSSFSIPAREAFQGTAARGAALGKSLGLVWLALLRGIVVEQTLTCVDASHASLNSSGSAVAYSALLHTNLDALRSYVRSK